MLKVLELSSIDKYLKNFKKISQKIVKAFETVMVIKEKIQPYVVF